MPHWKNFTSLLQSNTFLKKIVTKISKVDRTLEPWGTVLKLELAVLLVITAIQ
jgi:hypothetical protein